ncbi:MAG: hypothetical protein H6Q20_1777 [Bacteroidetes bacterium]|nr:hypothetical protein [Bacteroidota bacterium]
MKNIKLNFILIIVVFSSCNSSIDRNDLIGIYKNSNDSAIDYNSLILREDSTYLLVQSPLYSDIFPSYYGFWEVKNKSVYLYCGFDFTDYIVLDTVCNSKSQTLTIELDSSLIKKFPHIKLSINGYKDLNIIGNRLTIKKEDYIDKDFFNIENTRYDLIPVEINLRQKNYYAKLGYVFGNEKIRISIKKHLPDTQKNVVLKYFVRNSILESYDENTSRFRILRKNELRKMTETEINSIDVLF